MTRSDIHRQGSHVYSVPALLPAAPGDRDGVILAKAGNTQSAEPAHLEGLENQPLPHWIFSFWRQINHCHRSRLPALPFRTHVCSAEQCVHVYEVVVVGGSEETAVRQMYVQPKALPGRCWKRWKDSEQATVDDWNGAYVAGPISGINEAPQVWVKCK